MSDIFVIGHGVAGMTGALFASENNNVTILEHMDKGGKKLLLTGNGRCNLSNELLSETCYNPNSREFINRIFDVFSQDDLYNFLSSLGIHTKSKNGYIYPRNEQSIAVLNCFEAALARKKIKTKFNQTINSVKNENDKFLIETPSYTYKADKVILATGGMSYPSTGSDGSGYALGVGLGHTCAPPLPALTALKTKDELTNICAGVRCDAYVSLYVDKKLIKKAFGELQITKGYLSGILIYELSSFAVKALNENKDVAVHIDFLPNIDNNIFSADDYKTLINLKILDFLGNNADFDHLKNYTCTITGYKGFDYAQVTSGGISIDEIYPYSMESKLIKNLYFAGEMIDVDGICGGYNITFAIASGAIAGRNASINND